MSVHDDFFPNTIALDFFKLMCGEQLGAGAHREVYVFEPDPRYVLKFETETRSFSNIREWDIWNDVQYMSDAVKGWLAPCKNISPCGIVLMQRRTTPAKRYPDKIPSWMTDTKRSNFGMLGKRFVAHDYGNHLVANAGITRRLKKAYWWDSP